MGLDGSLNRAAAVGIPFHFFAAQVGLFKNDSGAGLEISGLSALPEEGTKPQ